MGPDFVLHLVGGDIVPVFDKLMNGALGADPPAKGWVRTGLRGVIAMPLRLLEFLKFVVALVPAFLALLFGPWETIQQCEGV